MDTMHDGAIPLPQPIAAFRVCPVCCGDLERVEAEDAGAHPHLRCVGRCHREWFANPKPTVNVLAERADDGRLLLVRRAKEPFRGAWDICGGFMESGEEAEDGARRELLEETGLEVGPLRFLAAFSDVYGGDRGEHTVNLFWIGTCDDPERAAPASDVAEIGWFTREQLPPADELAFDCVPRAVAAWAATLGH